MTILLGDNTNTGTQTFTSGQQLDGTLFQASASGTASVASAYIGTAGVEAYLALYSSTAGSPNGTLIAQSNLLSSSVVGWNSFTFATPPTITSGDYYWLMLFRDAAMLLGIGQAASGSYSGFRYENATWPTAPSSLAIAGFIVGNNLSAYLSTSSGTASPGQFFFTDAKIPGAALAMFMPLSWAIGRRNRLAKERREDWQTERRIPVPRNRESP